MADLREQIADLLDEADDLEHGTAQLALTEEAVELADALRDVGVAFFTRSKLVGAATFAGRTDIAMVAYSWLLTKYDEAPEDYDSQELLWQYKWILENVADFPNIRKEQIDALFDDMKRRYKSAGATLHAYWGILRNNAFIMGDPAEAKRANAKLLQTPRDHLSNCLACVQDEEVEYCTFIGDDAGALRAAKPILTGKMKCGEVPERTYAGIAMPLIRLGKHGRALEHYQTGYRLIRQNPKFVRHKGMFLVALTLTGNLDRAVKLLDRHLPEAIDSASPWWRFEFYLAARLLLEKLADTGRETVPIRVPEKVDLGDSAESPKIAELSRWLDAELVKLATAFDARNGNAIFTERCLFFRDLFELAEDCPLE